MLCQFCLKCRQVANRVSHSNIKTKKRQSGNIQRLRAKVNGNTVRVYACTRCIRSGCVEKAA
ncbi:MAG: 50S ribosomal protein L28 [Deltaproteobacteria bacterium]|nr:MAG: 50S ribosomal protein L28 [Deltaproteobacteria bacterium]